MKKLEIIRKILEEKPNAKISQLILNDEVYNLAYLCILNKKYLTNENLKFLIETDSSINKAFGFDIKLGDQYSITSLLISAYPELCNKLPKETINNLTIEDWAKIISNQPQLIEYCNLIDNFDSKNWIKILDKQPQLVSKYDDFYKKTSQYDLYDLIYYGKNKITDYIDLSLIYIKNDYLSRILSVYPEGIKKIDIKKLSPENWVEIFRNSPDSIKDCPIIDKVKLLLNTKIESLVYLLSKQLSFIYLLDSDTKINRSNLINIITNQPKLIEKLNVNFKKFTTKNWIVVLSRQPQLIDKCDKIKDFSAEDWSNILAEQPNLINHCDKIKDINVIEWINILNKSPELIKYCEIKNDFTEFNWYTILKSNIELYAECDKPISSSYIILQLLKKDASLIDKLDNSRVVESDFVDILYDSKEYSMKVMNKYIEKYKNPIVLTNMIGIYPNLKEFYTENDLWKYVDFNKLSDNLEYGMLK